MNRALIAAFAVAALSCESARGGPPGPVASVHASVRPAASAARPRASVAKPAKKPRPRPRLAALRVDSKGRYRALDAKQAVRVVPATKQRPLAPYGPAVHYAIGALVAPEVVAKTELRELLLSEMLGAVDEPTRRAIAREARVLGNGRVACALIALPGPALSRIDLANLAPGRPVFAWEAKLFAKETPPKEIATLLAAYQKLLAVDYLVDNRVRREALWEEENQVLVAVDDNDAFSARFDDRGVGDPFRRLSAHGVFSKSLAERLRKLDGAAVERALRSSPDGSLMVTPKQAEEVLERRQSLERLIEARVRLRGRAVALALP